MLALILAAGEVPTRAYLDATWPAWADGLSLVVAADGGAEHAAALGVAVELWVGDGDSVSPATLADLVAAGASLLRSPTDKDETDTELAILAALDRGADGIVLLGATGGPRLDHELANLALLAMPRLAPIDATIYTDHARIRLLRDDGRRSVALGGRPGDLVSLLPLGGAVDGVRTTDLRYPLRDEPLPLGTPRGLSNVIAGPDPGVSIDHGMLLVIETPATIPT